MLNLRTRLLNFLGIVATLFAVGVFGFAGGLRWVNNNTSATAALVLDSVASPPSLPLRIDPSRRHLIDADGAAFLVHGDTAWSLIADLTREEVDVYLADRRARGFNTLLVNLLEHKFAQRAPANTYGVRPFLDDAAFVAPNEAYFAHADWVLRRAREQGFVVLLTPAYAGYGGKDEGWWQQMVASGEATLRTYGRYLGTRYRDFDNIIWVGGGDYDPPNRNLVRAIALGIKEAAPSHLQTIHLAPESSSVHYARKESWIDFTTVYTYGPVCPKVREAYAANPVRPTILFESAYENERGADELRVRTQAYQALLCGAAGQIFGNNPIWHFKHPGLVPAPGDWWQNLGSRGAQSMTHLRNLFGQLRWWELEPEGRGALLAGRRDRSGEGAVAAMSPDRRLAVVYLPTRNAVTLDASKLSGEQIESRWYDPSSGEMLEASADSGQRGSKLTYTPPSANQAGSGDWVLVVRAR